MGGESYAERADREQNERDSARRSGEIRGLIDVEPTISQAGNGHFQDGYARGQAMRQTESTVLNDAIRSLQRGTPQSAPYDSGSSVPRKKSIASNIIWVVTIAIALGAARWMYLDTNPQDRMFMSILTFLVVGGVLGYILEVIFEK